MTLPLMLFVAGIFIYAFFVYKFYRFLAKKEIFKLDLHKYGESVFGSIGRFFSVIIYMIKYLIIFPLFIFFWFGILSLILAVLSRNHAVSQILLLSMALVAAIRIAAYYNEDLSKDLAKMMPFALLGVFLVDMSFFSLQTTVETIKQFPLMWKQMAYYLYFTIALELFLRVVHFILTPFRHHEEE